MTPRPSPPARLRRLALWVLVPVLLLTAGAVAVRDEVEPRFWAAMMQVDYLGREGVRLQTSSLDCGVAAMEMLLASHGTVHSLDRARAAVLRSGAGLTMADLIPLAEQHALTARAYRATPAALPRLRTPFIAHFRRHYVVVDTVGPDSVLFRDPALGRLRATRDRFVELWSGHVLLAAPATEPGVTTAG